MKKYSKYFKSIWEVFFTTLMLKLFKRFVSECTWTYLLQELESIILGNVSRHRIKQPSYIDVQHKVRFVHGLNIKKIDKYFSSPAGEEKVPLRRRLRLANSCLTICFRVRDPDNLKGNRWLTGNYGSTVDVDKNDGREKQI